MSPEEIVSRLLYRDGLMLVIDKPAGIHVHRGPKGGASLEDSFDALRFGCRAGPRSRTGSIATRRAASCSAAIARRWPRSASCSRTARSARPIGPWSKAGRQRTKAASTCARQARRKPRLVDEAGPQRPAGIVDVESDGHGDGLNWLALEPLTGRTHQLRVHCAEMGLACLWRQYLWQRAAHRRTGAASAFARSRGCRSTRTRTRSSLPRRCPRT